MWSRAVLFAGLLSASHGLRMDSQMNAEAFNKVADARIAPVSMRQKTEIQNEFFAQEKAYDMYQHSLRSQDGDKLGGLIYLWVDQEQSYATAHANSEPGKNLFLTRNKHAKKSKLVQGFQGVNYNQLADVDPWEFVSKKKNAFFGNMVPRSDGVPAIPDDHAKKAVAIFFSYCKLLKHISTLGGENNTDALYAIAENDQALKGDWEDALRRAANILPADGDAMIMKGGGCGKWVSGDKGGGWCKSTSTPPIGAWAVTPASATRVLRALKRHKLDCIDFDCVLGEMGRVDGLNVIQATGSLVIA